jgi:hypothetical protein
MRADNISEGIARQLKGRTHATGTFLSYESRGGKITVTSVCNQCGGPHSGISLANAAQAAQNRTVPLISCQHCIRTMAAPAKPTIEEALEIPEARRTSEQQRLVAEYEFERAKAAANAPAIAARTAAQAEATRQRRSMLWDQRERFLVSLAHSLGATRINDPRVVNHESFITWEQWQASSGEAREATNQAVDSYCVSNGLV